VRRVCAALLLLLCSVPLLAQENTQVLQKGQSEWGVFTAGGNGVGKRSSTHFFYVGGRYGRVLTGDHLSGPLRGNFEVRMELIPFEAVFQPPQNAWGGEFRPLVLIWNFKGNKTVKPYFNLGGGLLITNRDVPVNTNNVNFTPQGGMGFHFFTTSKRAITIEGKYVHVSNAGLDRRNSGINASFHFTLGYTWFK